MLPYQHFGGRHGEAAAIRNVLAFNNVVNPTTGKPFTEALCFGIAGGIGAGYSFCPSIVRHGMGSGVSVIGRHKSYATGATWYQDFADRLGFTLRITETAAPKRALMNLAGELSAGRPVIVYVSRMGLPFLDRLCAGSNLWMHSFVIYGIDEKKEIAYGGDRAPTNVTITLTDLGHARAGVCSHKNRTVTFDPPPVITPKRLQEAVRAGIKACAEELMAGRMKTFSLPGLQQWGKQIAHEKSKDSWTKLFYPRFLYEALRDVYETVETNGTGGGAYRFLYADFLAEAATLLKNDALATLSVRYRALGEQWQAFAAACLPSSIPAFKKTRALMDKKRTLYEEKGAKSAAAMHKAVDELLTIQHEMRLAFPLSADEAQALLATLSTHILALHEEEEAAAQELATSV